MKRWKVLTAARIAAIKRFKGRIDRLNEYGGSMTLDQVNTEFTRNYVAIRSNSGGARRDLQDLSAAISHHAREGLHREQVKLTLPKKGSRAIDGLRVTRQLPYYGLAGEHASTRNFLVGSTKEK